MNLFSKQQEVVILSTDQILEQVKQEHKVKRFVGMFSGGKDSLVASHLLWSKGLLDEVIYCKTGIGTTENFEFVKKTCKKYNWKLNILEPKTRFTYEKFVSKFGFPHAGMHSAIMGFLKWYQIRSFAKLHNDNNEGLCYVSGRRKKESLRRKKKSSVLPFDHPEKRIYIVSPIYFWTTRQVLEYVSENNLELCPVYETLHLSGDCLCGSFSELGESELIKTFHPDLAKKITKLEKKYGGQWGNQVSMSSTKSQTKISQFVCSDCFIDRRT